MRECNQCGKWVHVTCHPVGVHLVGETEDWSCMSANEEQSAWGTRMLGFHVADAGPDTDSRIIEVSGMTHAYAQSQARIHIDITTLHRPARG